ncbi:hypothetical protein PHLGIDRAFT_63060, partial [Phlebiopsis gigantea 11061_1 CR5-6]
VRYTTDKFPWSVELEFKLQNTFKIKEFRFCQLGICNASLDHRDIICIMPTGGGKSLTFQLPALITPGLTVVVSPLVALIVNSLPIFQPLVVPSQMLTSLNFYEHDDIMHQFRVLKLMVICLGIFLSIQISLALTSSPTRQAYQLLHVSTVYKLKKNLGANILLQTLRAEMPQVPVLATTATCSTKVLKNLAKQFKMSKILDGEDPGQHTALLFRAPLFRPNLHFSVVPKPSLKQFLAQTVDFILREHPQHSGIIFCHTIKNAEHISQQLVALSNGNITSAFFHSGLSKSEKLEVISQWKSDEVKVICATKAFGLGINKEDVYFVIHYTDNLSIYYQEAGRGGRNGQPTQCILFYKPQDFMKLGGVSTQLDGLKKCEYHSIFTILANLAIISRHFTQTPHVLWQSKDKDTFSRCNNCDNCKRHCNVEDVTIACWELIQIVSAIISNLGRVPLSALCLLKRGHIPYDAYSSSQKYDITKKLILQSIIAFEEHTLLITNYKSIVILKFAFHSVTDYLFPEHCMALYTPHTRGVFERRSAAH